MNAHLHLIHNWPALAHAAGYCVHMLARQCRVSPRSLQRHFLRDKGTLPWQWLHELRMKRASELLRKGQSVKETAAELGYNSQQYLSRDFRKHFGHPPSRHLAHTKACGSGNSRRKFMGMSQKDTK